MEREIAPPCRTGQLALMLVCACLAVAPALYATLRTMPDRVYSGALTFAPDHDLYAGWMRQTADDGRLLYDNPFLTSGDNRPVYFHPLWATAGLVTGIIGWPPHRTFLLLHLLAGGLLGLGLSRFIRNGRLWPGERTFVPGLFAFTAGGAGLFLLMSGAGIVTPDLYFPVVPLVQAAGVPHIGIATGLMLLAADRYLHSGAGTFRAAGLLGLALLLLVLVRPYDGVVICATVGLHGLLFRRRDLPRLLAAGLLPLAGFGYLAWLTRATDNFGFWAGQPFYPPPPAFVLPLTLGLPGALGLLVAVRGAVSGEKRQLRLFLAGWIGIAAACFSAYDLFHFAWMFHTSLLAPAGLLAVDFAGSTRCRRSVLAALFLLCAGSGLSFYAGRFVAVSRGDVPPLLPRPVENGLAWLGREAKPDSVVLSSVEYGIRIPAAGRFASVCGHKDLIPDWDRRRRECAGFFASREFADRYGMLKKHRVDYVFYGPADARAGSPPPSDLPFLRAVFKEGPVEIYRVLGM